MSEPVWVPLGAAPVGVGKELAYVERTTNLAISATTEAASEVFITAPAIDCDGQPIEIEFYCPVLEASTYAYLTLWDGSTNLGGLAYMAAAGGLETTSVLVRRKLVPTPGLHTYSIRATRGAGSGMVYAGPGVGGYMPAYLRISQRDVVPNVVPQGAPPLVTGLPVSPVDGQEVILCDSLTAPTYTWRFRYVATKASNKWIFVGGAPAESEVQTSQDAPGGTYTNPATPGPSFTVPVAGDYLIHFGCMFNDYANDAMWMSFAVGAVAATDADGIIWYPNVGGVSHSGSGSRIVKKTGVPASAAIVTKYKVGSSSRSFANRFLAVTPIAVGG
jgi:hypothetical protein